MPTYPQEPERAHKTRCSCTVLWPGWRRVPQPSEKHVPCTCSRKRKPVECHSKPAGCSKAGLLKTQRKTSQCASPICPPPSASLWDMPFHTLTKIKLNKMKALCDWARLATANH